VRRPAYRHSPPPPPPRAAPVSPRRPTPTPTPTPTPNPNPAPALTCPYTNLPQPYPPTPTLTPDQVSRRRQCAETAFRDRRPKSLPSSDGYARGASRSSPRCVPAVACNPVR
jgi:hypothetical protein